MKMNVLIFLFAHPLWVIWIKLVKLQGLNFYCDLGCYHEIQDFTDVHMKCEKKTIYH